MKSVLLALLLVACAVGPDPIRWGTDTCEQCRMILSDRRFGAEFVTDKGRVFKFDDVEEMGRFLADHPQAGTAYVTDGANGDLVPANTATLLEAEAIHSPMGSHLMSFAGRAAAEQYAQAQGIRDARYLTYEEVKRAGR